MINITYLKHHPTTIPAIANMWHKLLGQIWVPDISIETTIQRFHEHCNDTELPLSLIALDDNQPVGMCSLRKNDGIRSDLKPWLGSLVVDKAYQRQGVARLLIDAIKNKAKEMAYETCYLLTFDPSLPDYYRRHGWSKIGMDSLKGHEVAVMQINL